MGTEILGIGLVGKTLTDLERRILAEHSPYAVVLFGRNIGDVVQLKQLIAEVKAISKRAPLFMIDEEGGRVDRLRHIIPGLPSAESFGEGERPDELAEWHGRIIGMALRYFDIECNLAPVVDVRGDVAPKGLERRIFANDARRVTELAGVFMRGQQSWGTASCLKHFPGIGLGTGDSHYGATIIDASRDELMNRDLVPYKELGESAGAILIGHGTYPQIDASGAPASLSRDITHDLLRNDVGFNGLAVSDDMEMHAVSDLGSYESIAERALMAGNDVILFCSHIERVPDLQQYLRRRVNEDAAVRSRFDEARARGDRFREYCNRLRAEAGAPPRHFDEVIEEAIRFVEAFRVTRRGAAVMEKPASGTGQSGREEWT